MQQLNDHRPPSQSTMQVAGQAVSDVVGGLKQQPMLLALVCLNVVGIGAALWFLHELVNISQSRMQQAMTMLNECITRKPGS